MDSGNSGSTQSSSGGGGGDEEYDSRGDSSFLISTLLPTNPNLLLSHHQPTFYDPSSSFNPFTHQLSSNPNLAFNPSTTTTSTTHQISHEPITTNQPEPPPPPPQQQQLNQRRPFPNSSDHHHQTKAAFAPKNPKKRTRASRRAPTTVLTTDTSNFRAMVQEFTGIPAPPFSSSPYSSSPRLDLFGFGAPLNVGSIYPLRPLVQKVQSLTPLVSSSSTHPSLLNNVLLNTYNNDSTSNSMGTSSNSSTSFYQHPLNNMLNLHQNQNPVISFQSLRQQQHSSLDNYGLSFVSKSRASNFDELGHLSATLGGSNQDEETRKDHGNFNQDDVCSSRDEGRVNSLWNCPSE